MDPGETPEEAAQRELLEETGYEAEVLALIARIDQDSEGSERTIWLYVAQSCRKIQDGEKGITVIAMDPGDLFDYLIQYMRDQPGTKRRGLNSLAAVTLFYAGSNWIKFGI